MVIRNVGNFKSDYKLSCPRVISRVTRRLTTRILSDKCVVRRFPHCANVIVCTYTNLDSIAYYTPRLYGIVYIS